MQRLLPLRHQRRPHLHLVPQPLRPQALLHHELRGRHPQPRAPLQGDRLRLLAARRSRSTCRERPCPACKGARLRPESLAVTVGGLEHPRAHPHVREARDRVVRGARRSTDTERADRATGAARRSTSAWASWTDVGLGYLTLERPRRTLSGGEAQRIRLATQIGSSLVGVLYILDEPSIGLHQRDNERLIDTLERLRDLGNTVIVVEHDEETMRAADYIIDLGPGAGEHGGHVVAPGHAGGDAGRRRIRSPASILAGTRRSRCPASAAGAAASHRDRGRAPAQPQVDRRRRSRSACSSASPASRARASPR